MYDQKDFQSVLSTQPFISLSSLLVRNLDGPEEWTVPIISVAKFWWLLIWILIIVEKYISELAVTVIFSWWRSIEVTLRSISWIWPWPYVINEIDFYIGIHRRNAYSWKVQLESFKLQSFCSSWVELSEAGKFRLSWLTLQFLLPFPTSMIAFQLHWIFPSKFEIFQLPTSFTTSFSSISCRTFKLKTFQLHDISN